MSKKRLCKMCGQPIPDKNRSYCSDKCALDGKTEKARLWRVKHRNAARKRANDQNEQCRIARKALRKMHYYDCDYYKAGYCLVPICSNCSRRKDAEKQKST